MKFHHHQFRFILYLPVFVCAQVLFAQRDLKQILIDFEEQHGVQFSYLDDIVTGKSIIYDTALQADEGLALLQRHTRLRFEKLDDKYVIIREFRSDDFVSVCGRISNSSKKPLFGVSVGYSNYQGTFTDEAGNFAFDSIPYGSWLTIRYVGYATKKLKVSRLSFSECVNILMSESIEELDEIVVSDYLTVGISKNKNSIQIDPHTLKTLAGLAEPDILQSIQQVPGVNSPFETAAGLHVRGGLPDQNLILWNGISTYNQGHFFGMISAFNPYITDNVRFIKNGTPARFGGRVSSVIDISSRRKPANRFSGGAGTNMLFSDAYLEVPVIDKKLSIQLAARRSFTDFIQTPTYNQISDRVFQNTKIEETTSANQQSENSFYFADFSLNSVWEINNKNKLILNGLYNKNQLEFESEDDVSSRSFRDQLLHANEGLSIEWNTSVSPELSLDVSSSYSRYILRYDFIQTVPDTVSQSSKKNFVRDFSAKAGTSYKLSDKSKLLAGYNFSNERIRYAYETGTSFYDIILDSDNSSMFTHSGYIEYVYDNESMIIHPGVRLNHYQQLGESFIEPRLFLQKRLNNPLSVSFSAEYRTQVASQIKESVVSDLSLENKVWSLSSPDRFPVITSRQLATGITYQSKGWLAELEVYTKDVDGITTLIFGYLNGFENQFREGESQIYGSDLLLKKVWPQYETWVSYAYIQTENSFQNINNNRSFPGSWNIEHTIRWSNILNISEWEFSLGWLWHTGKSFTDVSTISGSESGPIEVFYEAINDNNLPVYHRLDISVMREFHSKKYEHLKYRIGFSLLNVYNRENLLNREFRTTPSLENELIDTRVYSLGITPNLVFRVFW